MDYPKGYRVAVTAALASLLLVVALAGTDVWVFVDAKR